MPIRPAAEIPAQGNLENYLPITVSLKLFFISVDNPQDSSLSTEQGQLDKFASSASILSPDELVSLQQEIALLGKDASSEGYQKG